MIVLDRREEAAGHHNRLAEAQQALQGVDIMKTDLKIRIDECCFPSKKAAFIHFILRVSGGKISEQMRQRKTFRNSYKRGRQENRENRQKH